MDSAIITLIFTTVVGGLTWVIKTTHSWTAHFITIQKSINDLKESNHQFIQCIRQIEAHDTVQGEFIDGLIKKHIEFTEELKTIKNELRDEIKTVKSDTKSLETDLRDVMQRLRMKPKVGQKLG